MLTTRTPLPTMIPRGKATTLSLTLIDGVTGQTPSAGEWTLRDPGNTVVLTKAPSLGSTSTVTIDATDLDGEAFGTGWVEEWVLTVGGVDLSPIRREAYLIRSDLRPVITDQDLYDLHSDLESLLPDDVDGYGAQRDAAWYQILARLIASENLPQTIVNSWALRTVHIYWTLAIIAQDYSTQEAGQGRWTSFASRYFDRAMTEYDALALKVDLDEDGDIDAKEVVASVMYTAAKAAIGRRHGRRGRR